MEFLRKRYNPSEKFSGIVQDEGGRILGRYETKGSDLLRDQIAFVREFLLKISKQGDNPMSKGNELVNQCYIAGEVRSLKTQDTGGFLLVDTGSDRKFIPCTVFDSKQLAAKLSRFMDGDYIKIVGFANSWSQKKDGKYQNHMDIRITEIRNEPPARRESKREVEQDEIPF